MRAEGDPDILVRRKVDRPEGRENDETKDISYWYGVDPQLIEILMRQGLESITLMYEDGTQVEWTK